MRLYVNQENDYVITNISTYHSFDWDAIVTLIINKFFDKYVDIFVPSKAFNYFLFWAWKNSLVNDDEFHVIDELTVLQKYSFVKSENMIDYNDDDDDDICADTRFEIVVREV